MYQVRKLLDDDPGNSEYADMEKELVEVILNSIYTHINAFIPFFLSFPRTSS